MTLDSTTKVGAKIPEGIATGLSAKEVEELYELRKKYAALTVLFEDRTKELHQVRQVNEQLSQENQTLKEVQGPLIKKLETETARLAASAINFGRLGLVCASAVPEALAVLPETYPRPQLSREDLSEAVALNTLTIFKDAVVHLKRKQDEDKAVLPSATKKVARDKSN